MELRELFNFPAGISGFSMKMVSTPADHKDEIQSLRCRIRILVKVKLQTIIILIQI